MKDVQKKLEALTEELQTIVADHFKESGYDISINTLLFSIEEKQISNLTENIKAATHRFNCIKNEQDQWICTKPS